MDVVPQQLCDLAQFVVYSGRASSIERMRMIRRAFGVSLGQAEITASRSGSRSGCGSSPRRTRSTDPGVHVSALSRALKVAGSYDVFRACSMLSTVDVDNPETAASCAML